MTGWLKDMAARNWLFMAGVMHWQNSSWAHKFFLLDEMNDIQ